MKHACCCDPQTANIRLTRNMVFDEAIRLFRHCLDALHDGYGMPTLIYAAQATQHILSLLLYRNRLLPTDQRSGLRRERIESAIAFMQANLNENLRLEDFAREAGMSVSHFSERFRRQTGQSPMASKSLAATSFFNALRRVLRRCMKAVATSVESPA